MRRIKSWLEGYLEYTKLQESPELFHFWTAVGIISAALGRSVWIKRDFYNVYPNHYIILLAESAMCRKSTCIEIGLKLLKDAVPDIAIHTGKITDASLWELLSENPELVLYSDELSILFAKEDHAISLISTLTRLYSCPDREVKKTKTQGIFVIENACLNMLTATTPTDLAQIFPEHTTGMGFTPRCHIVYQNVPRERRATLSFDPKLRDDLIADLRDIHKMQGEMTFTEDGWEWYSYWYEKLMEPPPDASHGINLFYGRKGDFVLKMSMIIHASEESTGIITKEQVLKALQAINKLEERIGKAYEEVGRSKSTRYNDRVLKIIAKYGRVSRTKLMQSTSHMLNAKELDEVLRHLYEMGYIRQVREGEKGAIFYEATDIKND